MLCGTVVLVLWCCCAGAGVAGVLLQVFGVNSVAVLPARCHHKQILLCATHFAWLLVLVLVLLFCCWGFVVLLVRAFVALLSSFVLLCWSWVLLLV